MIDTNFIRIKEEKVCNGCGLLITKEEPAFSLKANETISSFDIVLCEECGKTLKNDMHEDYKGFIKYGHITDEEIDDFGKFTDHEKTIIKEQYSKHKKDTFPNPLCALY